MSAFVLVCYAGVRHKQGYRVVASYSDAADARQACADAVEQRRKYVRIARRLWRQMAQSNEWKSGDPTIWQPRRDQMHDERRAAWLEIMTIDNRHPQEPDGRLVYDVVEVPAR